MASSPTLTSLLGFVVVASASALNFAGRGVHAEMKQQGTMGPLLTDTTSLTTGAGGCLSNPGQSNAICSDVGIVADANTCSTICANTTYCSSMTWHGPTTGQWAGHCVLRKDGVWAPTACGNGCDHTAANKTAGWLPYTVPWAPTVTGYTSRIKPFWFGANASGLDNRDTLALLAAHAVAGYGWQTGGGGGDSVGRGEEWQSAATTNVRAYLNEVNNPNNTVIFQYRQVQVALRLFAQCALAANDPSYDPIWLHDPTSPSSICTAGQPWGTADPYWDFTNSTAVSYWIDNVIGSLTADSSLQGGNAAVFFDECDQSHCGYRSGSCDFSKFNASQQQAAYIQMYGKMVRALNVAGIVPILSLDNRMNASSDGLPGAPLPCALPEDDMIAELTGTTWVRFYENWPDSFWVTINQDVEAAMISNAILEGEAGIPNVLHTGGACPAPDRNITRPGPLGGDIEFAVATYLVVQSPGTTLSISNDWYDANFCWRPDYNVDFGTPLGPAVRTGTHAWYRNYTRANVEVDVTSGRNGQVYLLA